jgi:MFS family permease
VTNRYFYGYNIVAAASLIQAVAVGGMFSYGVFFIEFEAEFGWSRATISGASSLTFLTMGAFGIVVGRLNDRFGPRWLMAASAVSYGLGFLLLSSLDTPWQLYLLYGILVGFGLSTHDVVTLSTVARWFVRRRGTMSGLVKAGTACGQLVAPLIAAALIASHGWRTGCFVIGAVALVLLLVAGQVLRRDPHGMGLQADGGALNHGSGPRDGESGLSLRVAARSKQLWILAMVQLTVFSCLLTVMVHIVPHAIDLGVSNRTAATVLSAIGGVSLIGRVFIGTTIDRIGGKRALMICFAVLLCSLLWLQIATETWMLFVFAAIYGFAHGGFFTAMSPTVAELFGTDSHGVLFGVVLFFGTIGGALGPLMAGGTFDITGSYGAAFLGLTALVAIGLVLLSLLRPATAQHSAIGTNLE